ncbi:MAG: hypothetical protein ACYCPS_03775 [Candidatus Saccharimonadales bacterium]
MEDSALPIVIVVGSQMSDGTLSQYVTSLKQKLGTSANVKYIFFEESEGNSISELYDIDENKLPAVLVIESDETFYKGWYAGELPDIDTVSYEVSQLTGSEE